MGGAFNGTVDITVQIFSAESGGASLWGPHPFTATAVQGGLFTLLLGGTSSPDIAPALDSGSELWLAFSVGGEPLLPRQRMLSVPFARRAAQAQNAAQLGGQPASAYATLSALPNAALSGSFNDLVDVPDGLTTSSGTSGAVPVFGSANSLSPSTLVQVDGQIGLGVAAPQAALHLNGALILGAETNECTPERAGALRWTGAHVEFCNGATWAGLGGGGGTSYVQASGGTITEFVGDGTNGIGGVLYRVHTFTSSGNFTVSSGGSTGLVEFLVVGGGGGGSNYNSAGGGGAGGMRTGTQAVGPAVYPIVVGAGGLGAIGGASGQAARSGQSSSAFGITALGGGHGGQGFAYGNDRDNDRDPGSGGSGGGQRASSSNATGGAGTAGQGHKGGDSGSYSGNYPGGGGGGAGGAGQNGSGSSVAGAGGPGLASYITGAQVYYAGGGGGSTQSGGTGGAGGIGGGGAGGTSANSYIPTSGAPNSGGGGGAGGYISTTANGANGGSGVVIVRYPIGTSP